MRTGCTVGGMTTSPRQAPHRVDPTLYEEELQKKLEELQLEFWRTGLELLKTRFNANATGIADTLTRMLESTEDSE